MNRIVALSGEKPRFLNAVGMKVAAEICKSLKPVCEKLVVAGSLRRRKPTVGDVEILYIGNSEVRKDPADMFASITVNLADEVIASLEKSGVLERRKNVNGSEMYGAKNKLMRHKATGLPVDLFAVLTEQCPCVIVRNESSGIATKPHTLQAALQRLQPLLRGEERESMQQAMQCPTSVERKQSEEAGQTLSHDDLQGVQKEIQEQKLLEGATDVRGEVPKNSASEGDVGPSRMGQGKGIQEQSRIHYRPRPESLPERRESAGASTSARDGKASEKAIDKVGSGASQKRNQIGQPIGKSGNRDAQDAHGESHLPSLSEIISDKMKCPLCAGREHYAPSWHNYLVCRTGPADSNTRICMAAQERGWKWNPYGAGFSRDGETRAMTSEEEVFAFVGLPYAKPEERR